MGALGEEEARLVRAWARRQRIAFFILAPLVAVVALGFVAFAIVSLIDGHLFSAVIALPAAIGLPLLTWWALWRPGSMLSTARAGDPTHVLRGTFTIRYTGRRALLLIGDTPIAIASRPLRRRLVEGEHYVVEVVHDSPALVVGVRDR